MGMTDKAELTDQEILDRLAAWVVERRMTAPAILFLESHRPLSFVGSQAMIAASPVVHVFESFFQAFGGGGWKHTTYQRFAELMEDRDNVERLIVAIERRSQERAAALREEKARAKALERVEGGGRGGWRFWRRGRAPGGHA
jgi:hypothetical protein